MIFPIVMHRCESWTIKKAEHWRLDGFELWCWRRLLRVCWTARRSNQSVLKELNPEYWLEGLMLKLKLQYLGHLMWRTNSLEKTLMLGKIEGRREEEDRGWDSWMASPTQWTWVWASSWSWWWTEKSGLLKSLGLQRVGHDWATELNWTELNWKLDCQGQICKITSILRNLGLLLKMRDCLWNVRSYLQFRISPRRECDPPGDSRGGWLCSKLEDKGLWLFSHNSGYDTALMRMCMCELTCFSCVQVLATSWTVACQASLSMEFSRQEWVAVLSSRGSSRPRDWIRICYVCCRGFLHH